MRAVRYHDHGGPEQLMVEEIDRPTPGSDEVLVKVRAASVNPVDTYFREGSYRPGDLREATPRGWWSTWVTT
jgi:NADPH2:quinone reductase